MSRPTKTQQVVGILGRLYEMRETAHRLFGDNYAERTDLARRALQAHCDHHGSSALAACAEIMKGLGDSPMAMFLVGAAAIDMMEETG
jgi:hypothetical protein